MDTELAEEMGRQARRLAMKQFNIERHLDPVRQVYEAAQRSQRRWQAIG
jgi:hypothetical protein